jgi:protein TonB
VTEVATLPSQTGRMSPGAVALAVGLHVAVAGALWWLSPLDHEDHAETPIMVTVDPQPLGGSGATASTGGGAPPTEATETPPPTPPAEPVQQAAAAAEPAPAAPTEPPPTPQAPPQMAEPLKPSEEEAEAKWQTEASAWKPHVTFENALPPPDAPPPPTSRDIPRPRPQQQARAPVQQRAQTAFPPRPVQPPAAQPGNTQTAASAPGPTNSALDSLSGHGGERNDYLTRVFRHIEPFRVYPEAARANRQRGRVVTRVTINRAGELVAVSVDRSSGWPLIDNAELAAIRRAMPLPPPPAGMPGDPLVLILPMTYNYEGR